MPGSCSFFSHCSSSAKLNTSVWGTRNSYNCRRIMMRCDSSLGIPICKILIDRLFDCLLRGFLELLHMQFAV